MTPLQQEEVRCPDCNKLLFKIMPEDDIHVDLETVCPRCKASFIWLRRNHALGRVLVRPVFGTDSAGVAAS